MKTKRGDSVIIKSVDNTEKEHGLDHRGVMKSMVGKRWEVVDGGDRALHIRSPKTDFIFTFSAKDIMIANEEPEDLDPIIFNFDPKHLEM